MGYAKVFVLLFVAGWAVGDKGPIGIQPHHITGQGGYDSFGQSHAPVPQYDSHGKGHVNHHPPAPTYGAPPHPPTTGYGPPKGDIPVVYYPIRRPKPEKEPKGYFKAFETKMKEYSDKFYKSMKDAIGYDDYDYEVVEVPAPCSPPANSYGAPPTDTYGAPHAPCAPVHHGPVVDYHYDYEEEKDKGFVSKMKDYYSKFAQEMEKAGSKMKEMFGYGDYDDYDYEVVEVPAPHHPAPTYGAPAPTYGAPVPAPAYGAPKAHPQPHHEPEIVYQAISRPKEPKAEKGSFFKAPKAPKRRPAVKKPRPGPVYHPAPTYHTPAAPVHHAPVHHVKAAVHHAPTYPAQSEYGPPKTHDITHGHAAAPVKAKGGHAHHAAPAQSSGVSSYTSH